MVQIRLVRPCEREFRKDVYGPGVVSLSRLILGSPGAGALLAVVALLSSATGVAVLYPPLAATCFLAAACAHLRVSRPKSIVVGHALSAVGGVAGSALGQTLLSGTDLLLPSKLGLAVALAAVLMQAGDADHPPAAATAAIPAVLPLPVEPWLLPGHMAFGGMAAVLAGLAWNRLVARCPAEPGEGLFGLLAPDMDRVERAAMTACLIGFGLMCGRPWLFEAYAAGTALMLGGVAVLSLRHFFTADIVTSHRA